MNTLITLRFYVDIWCIFEAKLYNNLAIAVHRGRITSRSSNSGEHNHSPKFADWLAGRQEWSA
jgi:hypothetical protein